MNISNIKLSFLLFLLVTISSCSTTVIALEEEPGPIVEMVKYNNNVKSIIDANCISCHISGGQASFLPLINYTQVKNAAESGNLISRMNSVTNPMPASGRVSADMLAVIDKWKADGFLEN